MTATPTDRFGLEVLGEEECFTLLASRDIGRIAVIAAGAPLVFPINYLVVDRTIVVRTAPGSNLVRSHGPVTVEVDETDRATLTGWSVMVRGHAEEITEFDAEEVRGLQTLGLRPWAGDKPVWLRIRPGVVTGRRLRHRSASAARRDHPAFGGESDDDGVVRQLARRDRAWTVTRVDNQRSRLHGRRFVSLVIRDVDGHQVAAASFDGPTAGDTVELTVVLPSNAGSDAVDAAASLVDELGTYAVLEGARRMVADFDARRADIDAVVAATAYPWTRHQDGTAARVEVLLV